MKSRLFLSLLALFIVFQIGFVSASICKGSDGYYHECEYSKIYVGGKKVIDLSDKQVVRHYDYNYKIVSRGKVYDGHNIVYVGYDKKNYYRDYDAKRIVYLSGRKHDSYSDRELERSYKRGYRDGYKNGVRSKRLSRYRYYDEGKVYYKHSYL